MTPPSTNTRHPWMIVTMTAIAGLSLLAASYILTSNKRNSQAAPAAGECSSKQATESSCTSQDTPLRIAFLGNSILYYNDCPRLLQHMIYQSSQNSCLRGGASLISLLTKGNGMQEKFATPNALLPNGEYDIGASTVRDLLVNETKWDFIVMNDYTQAPAREETRNATETVLRDDYVPLLKSCGATPVLLQTAAYRKFGIRDTEDLGTVEEFTQKLYEGYGNYSQVLSQELPESQGARVAPVGNAFLYVHNHHESLWHKLFWEDNFHPSPCGTWLEACVLFCTLTEQTPPVYNKSWWDSARYFPTSNVSELVFPSSREAEYLRQVAMITCGLQDEGELQDPQ